ncbi:hypothetical protein AAFF_G00218250 [Aldrovandia affinis]|uniref:Uncharacterized protein n=1 Tax=Aldrovandia affinis TaxID=143900 RepID=A0AAD7WUB0_9TELE|nr:hypothetical protein AAFF_G00218250 [Aldrovandia affinis]
MSYWISRSSIPQKHFFLSQIQRREPQQLFDPISRQQQSLPCSSQVAVGHVKTRASFEMCPRNPPEETWRRCQADDRRRTALGSGDPAGTHRDISATAVTVSP